MHRYLLLLTLLLSAPALAQTELAMPNCTETPAPIDSTNQLIAVKVKPVDPNSKVPYQFLDGLARVVASHLQIPQDAELRVLTKFSYRPGSRKNVTRDSVAEKPKAIPSVDASIYFTLSKDGEISKIVKANTSANIEVMSSIMQAMQDAFYGGNGAIVLPPEAKARSVGLELSISTFPDSTLALANSIQKRWQPAHWIKLPVYAMSKDLKAAPNQPMPSYPKNALYSGTDGKVTILMAVNEQGKVIPGSVDVTEAKYADFLREVLKTVPEMRFEPAALANGCAVPFEAMQPYQFTFK